MHTSAQTSLRQVLYTCKTMLTTITNFIPSVMWAILLGGGAYIQGILRILFENKPPPQSGPCLLHVGRGGVGLLLEDMVLIYVHRPKRRVSLCSRR